MNSPPLTRHARGPAAAGGFTLVELLVAIAIVIVLAAVSFVAMRGVKQKAMQTKAIGPLRQIAEANMAYALENGGINTLKWVGDPEEGKPYVGNSFWGRMQPLMFPEIDGAGQKQLQKNLKQQIGQMFSSTDPDKMTGTLLQGAKIYHDGSGLPIPFAFNKKLHKWGDWINVNRAGSPAETIYISYGFGMFDEEDGRSYVPMPTNGSKPDNNIYYLPSGKAMVAFLDGHMERLAPPISERKFGPLED
jgi:prepilin-type processing-associated H-X9-DG protein